MKYTCPRCQGMVQRKSSRVAGAAGGVAGALIFAAVAPLHCETCGNIPLREFPPEVRSQARLRSVLMVLGAVILFVVVIVVLVALKH
jgi:hypothetical protein